MRETQIRPRPFLKWVGGKRQLLPELLQRVQNAELFSGYHEPFVGGGALFFELARLERLGERRAYLSDNNLNLIEAYHSVREHLEPLLALLQAHKAAHGKEYYYAVRATVPAGMVERAARLIYLNKTCFNGLYRENSRGEFNVPMGSYKNPAICDEPNLRAVADALCHAEVEHRHFRTVLDRASRGDFVYLDPPYHPVSATSSFTMYAQGNFGEADQEELAAVCRSLDTKGVKFLLSNSYTPFIRSLYADFKIEEVFATRLVNSKAEGRGKVSEALVRNY